MFITFEGLDGSGKTTQLKRLAAQLADAGYKDVLLTYEPGGSDGAKDIRKLLLDRPPELWDAREELLLYSAARHHHLRTLIQPALDRGAIVLCDRFFDSTAVYQGSAVGEAEAILASIRELSIGDVVPDLTILLDLDERESMRRVAARGALNRLEQREAAFFARVRAGYLALAQAEPERFLRFDATQSEAALAQEIGQRVLAALDARLQPG